LAGRKEGKKVPFSLLCDGISLMTKEGRKEFRRKERKERQEGKAGRTERKEGSKEGRK
jgi:hypothetical protein